MENIIKHLQVTHVEDQIDYVDNVPNATAIASFGKSSVRVLSLKAKVAVPDHTSPYDTMILILKGKIKLAFGSNSVELAAGDATLIPANDVHNVLAYEDSKFMLTVFGQ